MLKRIFGIVQGQVGGGASGFEQYFTNLQYRYGTGAPTRKLARRDYLDRHRLIFPLN